MARRREVASAILATAVDVNDKRNFHGRGARVSYHRRETLSLTSMSGADVARSSTGLMSSVWRQKAIDNDEVSVMGTLYEMARRAGQRHKLRL